MCAKQLDEIDFAKGNGLVPAIIQDFSTGQVLMVGYMSDESLRETVASGLVTFYSRSKNRLWTKGESSGNHLAFVDYAIDCDGDALLIRAEPSGPVCHTGSSTCFVDGPDGSFGFLGHLEAVINQRAADDDEGSYTKSLLENGSAASARKVGEEAVEVAIASLDESQERVADEAADLLYHLLVLLKSRDLTLSDVVAVLASRHTKADKS